jgi:hypothetical protein
VARSGRPFPPLSLRLLLGVQFSFDLRMGNGNQTLHKTFELPKIALNILGRMSGARWLLRHVNPSGMRVFVRASKVNLPEWWP